LCEQVDLNDGVAGRQQQVFRDLVARRGELLEERFRESSKSERKHVRPMRTVYLPGSERGPSDDGGPAGAAALDFLRPLVARLGAR